MFNSYVKLPESRLYFATASSFGAWETPQVEESPEWSCLDDL